MLNVDHENQVKLYRKKNEKAEGDEMAEEDLENIKAGQAKLDEFATIFNDLAQENFFTQFYKIDANKGMEYLVRDANRIFQNRVLCCDIKNGDYEHYSKLFASICQ